jgi:hypothetical protein
MDPYSIEGNLLSGSQSSLSSLKFRAPLGTMLDNDTSSIVRISIHPSYTSNPSTPHLLQEVHIIYQAHLTLHLTQKSHIKTNLHQV